jgi:hypothetical protein
MHTEIGALEILFRLSIFSLVAYKLYDLAKKYLLPMLSDAITQEKKEQTELLAKEKLLASTQKRIKGHIYNQKQMLTLLERNVQVWHAALVEQKKQYEQHNRDVILSVADKRAVQNRHIALAQRVEASVPAAVAMATQKLEEAYRAAEGKRFLVRIIGQLESEGS